MTEYRAGLIECRGIAVAHVSGWVGLSKWNWLLGAILRRTR